MGKTRRKEVWLKARSPKVLTPLDTLTLRGKYDAGPPVGSHPVLRQKTSADFPVYLEENRKLTTGYRIKVKYTGKKLEKKLKYR